MTYSKPRIKSPSRLKKDLVAERACLNKQELNLEKVKTCIASEIQHIAAEKQSLTSEEEMVNSREERNREEPELLNEWRLNLEEGKSSLADISQYIDTEKLRLADKETVLNERKKDKTKRLDNAFKLVKEGVKQRRISTGRIM
ncbi:MAG: hypothetical protein L6R39_000895 [Caloplaca ligustica]|nr:MAG: hypothetical protein L6R39_000895 [Caloplaca ligustica]